MQHIDLETLVTVTGGAATVSGAKKLDTQTTQLLTNLTNDIKDLSRNSTNTTSQMMPLMMAVMMSRR